MRFNSWTQKEVLDAILIGKPAYELDTGQDGNDDVLIGTERRVLADVLSFFDLDELPEHWQLRRVLDSEIYGLTGE